MDRDLITQLTRLLRPLATRVANTVARGVVQLANDGTKLQSLQLGVLAGETIDGAEHHQPYGFASVPLGGAEAVVVFPNGDRSHPLVVAVSDRRYRPTGSQAGEVVVYNNTGAKITITKDGDIKVTPAAGRKVLIDDGAGATAIPTMADFNGLISIMSSAGVGASTALPAAVTTYRSSNPTWPVGTGVLKAK